MEQSETIRQRIITHALKEMILVKDCWMSLCLGIFAQYMHSVATNVVYYLHVQGPRLEDNGFKLFGEVPESWDPVSEVAFFGLLVGTIIYGCVPFFSRKPKFYFTHVLRRVLIVGSLAQVLRICSFLVTILPSPAIHCQPGSTEYDPPKTALEIFFRVDGVRGCGDLIFSSHTLLATTMFLTINKYSPHRIAKVIALIDTIFLGLMVVALKKHYSIDVVVAWYTIPMLYYVCEHKFPDYVPDELAAHIGMTVAQARAQSIDVVIMPPEVVQVRSPPSENTDIKEREPE